MYKKISLDDACKILADVAPEQCFWINNGPIIRNLQEMADALNYMEDQTFMHHINKDKNDFANWVRDVLKDEELAGKLVKIKSKEKILKEIKNRIKFLENRIEKEELINGVQ